MLSTIESIARRSADAARVAAKVVGLPCAFAAVAAASVSAAVPIQLTSECVVDKQPPCAGTRVAQWRRYSGTAGVARGSATASASSSVVTGTKRIVSRTSGGSSARSGSLSAGRMNVLMP